MPRWLQPLGLHGKPGSIPNHDLLQSSCAQSFADPEKFVALPLEHKQAVLLGLWYCLNWFRELISAFGTQVDASR